MSQFEDMLFNYLKKDPDASMFLGLTHNANKLGNPSLEDLLSHIEQKKVMIEEMENGVIPEDFHEQVDLSLMKRLLKIELFFETLEIDGMSRRERLPNGVDGISEGIFQLFVNDERDPLLRLENILSRLKQAPGYLKEELSVLKTPIERWRNIEVTQAGGLPELFESILDWAVEIGFSKADELSAEINSTNKAINEYVEGLKNKETSTKFAIGIEKVKELLALRQIEKSPEELRVMAETYMKETASEIETLRKSLNTKHGLPEDTDVVKLQEFLTEKHAVELKDGKIESILDHYHEERRKILDFIKERDLFPVPDNQDMVILQTPSFLEPLIPAGAMWPPLALREGTKKSMVYLTLKEGELAEHTHLGIPVMMVHEGIPGHHLQFATAALHKSLIRRIYGANEHAEGWTTMLEDYMLDKGYVDADLVDEVRFIAKREMSRLIARVGIDLYFMSGDIHFLNVGIDLEFTSEDPFENAATLLKTATGFTDGRVQAELNWYSIHHGYPLSYLTGNRLVWEMKNEIFSQNKKNLSEEDLDREFHRIYLESGNMPVATLREVFKYEELL